MPTLLPEPSYAVAWFLFPMEKFRGEWRRHPIRMIRAQVIISVLALVGYVAVRHGNVFPSASRATDAIFAAAGIIGLAVNFSWYSAKYVLTNRRIILVDGLLWRRVSDLPLGEVRGLRCEQSAFGRLLKYGDFVFSGAAWLSPLSRVVDLPYPLELYLQIVEELYDPETVEARLVDVNDGYRSHEWERNCEIPQVGASFVGGGITPEEFDSGSHLDE